MLDKEVYTPFSKVLLSPDGKETNKAYIEIILQEEIPVFCENKSENKYRLMPFKVLYDNNEYFWLKPGNWEYGLTKDGLDKLNEKIKAKQAAVHNETMKDDIPELEELTAEELTVEVGYGKEYNEISKMTHTEKIDKLNKDKNRLHDLVRNPSSAGIVTEAIVDTTSDAALINHAYLEEAMRLGDEEAKKFTQELVDSTSEMVKSSTHLVMDDVFSNELMSQLVSKSNGTIVQHITRVFVSGISFLAYYNKLVSTSSAIQRIRISFPSKYRSFYVPLLPHLHIEDLTMEHVFCGGMRAISPELLHNWAIGFLIHDIGKATAVEYHEGEAAYNRDIVTEHVKQGFNYIMKKTNYPKEAGLITGYHHEYYGSADGYGYFRAYLQQYKKHNPAAKQDYCIAYDREPILDFKAHAYFPAKILEIIDIYDSLTDPNRAYKKPMAPEEALVLMKEQFIVKQRKIDFILFDIFAAFIRKQAAQRS